MHLGRRTYVVLFASLPLPLLSVAVTQKACAISRLSGLYLVVGVVVLLLASGCARKALVSETYDASFYEVQRTLPDTLTGEPLQFLVVGDTQASWRAEWKFYRRDNWATWWQLAVPFYQVYLLGEGLVGGINYLRQKPDHGADKRLAVREAMQRTARDTTPQFILHTGDMASHDGRYAEHWGSFLQEYGAGEESLLHAYPFLPALGNHDEANDESYGWPNYDAIFDYPRFYVKDLPEAALFVLDSNFLVDQTGTVPDEVMEERFQTYFVGTADEPSWLERELEKRADVPLKIIAMHHPLATLSWHERDFHKPAYGPDLLDKRQQLLQLVQEHEVNVQLSGHEHLYEHNYIPSCEAGQQHTFHTIISSGGGAIARATATDEELRVRANRYRMQGFDIQLGSQVSDYHYTWVTLEAGVLTFDTYAVDTDAPYEAQHLDEVVVTPEKKACRY